MVEEASDNSRRLPACERCRIRKTKCDSQLPSCSNCSKAGAECINKDRVLGRVVSRSYMLSLERHIQTFEDGRQPNYAVPQESNDGRNLESPNKRRRMSQTEPTHGSGAINHHVSEPIVVSPANNSHNSTQLGTSISSGSTVGSNDRWGGQPPSPSSWSRPIERSNYTPPPQLMDEEVETPVHRRSPTDTVLTSALLRSASTHVSEDITREIRRYSGSFPRGKEREQFIRNENAAIAELGREFLREARRIIPKAPVTDITAYDSSVLALLAKRYFTWMNSAHPVLHECMFHLQMERYRANPSIAADVDSFQVNMVFAIALASISRPHLSTSEIGRYAHDFWKIAVKHLSQVLSTRGLPRLQCILMLVQYTLLVPRAGNLWQLSGSATRFATEMGLYAEPNPGQSFDPLTLDLRRRVFWTCYCIDRVLATVMGRPTGVPDEWITTEIPALVEDRNITVRGIRPGPTCQLKVAQVLQIQLCQLQSEIHGRLYAASLRMRPNQHDLTTWSWQIFDQLRIWRNSFHYSTPLITKEWVELQFHISIVLLFRPSPNRPTPSDEALHVAFHSAGEALRIIKIMHRDMSAVFSWLSVLNLFMCGLTFINCLKELTEKRASYGVCTSLVEIFLQIQSCSAMLETLSALEAGDNERIRDVFETASSNILHSLESLAPSLGYGRRQQEGSQGCIWARIAKGEDLNVQRPILVDGTSVSIKTNSEILQDSDINGWDSIDRPDAGPSDDHFFVHDIDASGAAGTLQGPLDQELYFQVTTGGRPPSRATSLTPAPDESTGGFNSKNTNANVTHTGPPVSSSVPRTDSANNPRAQTVESLLDNTNMDRLAAISSVAAAAEPIRPHGDFTADTELGAELERWFFYPFPDFSPPNPSAEKEDLNLVI
uniref:ARAD1A19866p n=1 Tax=Blastobotrys adeninivorans TaxID=409370 RepID=A0A060SYU7_BLAAD